MQMGNNKRGGFSMNVEKAIAAFREKGYEVTYCETEQEAADYLNQKIDGRKVGFGDSHTLINMKLSQLLASHNQVLDPINRPAGTTFYEVAEATIHTDIFLSSVNAAAETGELVNIDGTGNRVIGTIYGHEKVYFVFGVNKLAPTLDEAIWRARNIAAPLNAKRWGANTPCAVKGDHCYDCDSEDRICCALVVHYRKTRNMEAEIVLINDDLGF